MSKNIKKYLIVSGFALCISVLSVAIFSNGPISLSKLNATGNSPVWNHYDEVEPTDTTRGIREYWVSCDDHTHQFEEPTSGQIVDRGAPSMSFINSLSSDDNRVLIASMDILKFKKVSGTFSEKNEYRVYVESESDGGDLVVPCSYLGLPVTTVYNDAFSNCASLTSIWLPSTITTIGNYAFKNTGLLEIVIPSGVTSVGTDAFRNCTQARRVIWKATSCTTFGSGDYYTFNGNTLMTSAIFTDNVISIPNRALNNCTYLTSITIPNSVTSIGSSAFNNCNSITSLYIPDSVSTIGSAAFQRCTSLTSIHLPSGISTFNTYLFSGCSSLTSFSIPNTVTTINNYAFQNCSGLLYVDVPESVTSVGSGAFDSCSSLELVYWNAINSTVSSLGDGIFASCSKLTEIQFGSSVEVIPANIMQYRASLTTVRIYGSSLVSIGNSAFWKCSKLTTINLPSSLTSIGNNAFNYCSKLPSIRIPLSVTTMGSNVFQNCNELLIYCEVSSKPDGWDDNWNSSDKPVYWNS